MFSFESLLVVTSLIITGAYCLGMIWFITGIHRSSTIVCDRFKVSIVVAARDEGNRIEGLLNDLFLQKHTFIEVIVVDDHSEDSDTVLPGLEPAASVLALGPQEQKSAPHADVTDEDRGRTRKKRQVVPKPPPREVASRRILLALADSDDADENNHDNMNMSEGLFIYAKFMQTQRRICRNYIRRRCCRLCRRCRL